MGGFARRYDILLTAFLFLFAIPAQHFEWFALLEDQTLTFRHQLRLAYGDIQANSLSRDIVLVNTDEAFFKAYKSFPLRRTDIAALVTNLKALGARVIAVDMLMDFPSSYGEDPALAQALNDAGNTLLVAQAEFQSGQFKRLNRPTDLLDRASASAYTNIQSNSSQLTTLSRLRVYPEITGERGGWPFAVVAAAMALGVEPKLDGTVLRLGDLAVPLDHSHHLYIDFPPLPKGSRFLSQTAGISALDFLDISGLDDNERAELSAWVADKIVVVGDTSEVSHDWFDTPVGMVYGVEIIADSISSILKGAPLRAASPELAALVPLVLLGLMVLLALRLSKLLSRGVAVLGLLVALVAACTLAYVRLGLVLPMSYGLTAIILSYLLIEFRQYQIERDLKKQIAGVFSQYLPKEVVDQIAKDPVGAMKMLLPSREERTVLFSDVRGFTTVSEGLDADRLAKLMNLFLGRMTKVIFSHGGTIDKYMGDAIMAFWGAPVPDPAHARNAVRAALDMIRTQDGPLADELVAGGWPKLKFGIGLNTGPMSIGNMGSELRLAYTALSDAVNLGSRTESLTKFYGVSVMITEFTKLAVDAYTRQNGEPALVCRELDLARVKGKEQGVGLFEPLGFGDEVSAETHQQIDRYHAALALYRSRRWDEAEAAFRALAADEPGRRIHTLYLERIEHVREDPPGEDWDGVYTHKEK